MNNKRSKNRIRICQGLLLAGALCLSPGASAQDENEAPKPAPVTATHGAHGRPQADGSHQGIKIHGHWSIEIRNPDGKLVTHREFENAYVSQLPGGAPNAVLAAVLAGSATLQGWIVALDGSPEPCFDTIFMTPRRCLIDPPGFTGGDSPNLSVSQNGGKLVFSGSVTAAAASSISQVQTQFYQCPVNSNGGCVPVQTPFTSATLAPNTPNPPISVLAGQTVQVTVIISFT